MFYREAGQFKTSYKADSAIFPILQDRIAIGIYLAIAFIIIPYFGNDFFINSFMIPFLVFALAAIGLNILTGYTGQISLGTGAFMGVGAYACYKLATIFPEMNILVLIVCSGFFFCRNRNDFWPSIPSDQGVLSGGNDPGCSILPRMVFHSNPLAVQLQRFRCDRSPYT